MGAIRDEDFFKRANDFYTSERVSRYGSRYKRKGERYPHIKKVIAGIKKKFDKKINVLDLGCGEGRYFHLFGNTNLVVGVDASKEMLETAAKNADREKKNVKLIRANILSFTPKEKFDLAISMGVLCEHTPLTAGLLDTIYNCLNKDGYFFFTTAVPAGMKHTLRRKAGDLALLAIRPFIGKGKTYRKLLNSYAKPEHVRLLINSTRFHIEESKRVNNKGSSIDQHFWLLRK